MSLTIGSNIASLRAQRQLASANESQNSTLERLSSGLRINRASDDAAGLAIASSLSANSRIYTQAQRNISDGVSMLSIAGAATDQLQLILDRQGELAAQSANGVYSSTQRSALDVEFQELTKEYNRILATTEFNGTRIFDTQSVRFQAGFGLEESLRLALGESIRKLPARITMAAVDNSGNESGGVGGISVAQDASMSGDGRYVVFGSNSSTLVPGDSNAVTDIFLRDTVLGTTTRVSTASDGTQANAASTNAVISSDGRYVYFVSGATNLVSGDSNGMGDLFRKDLQSGTVIRINLSSTGAQADNIHYNFQGGLSVSDDNRYVAFTSWATTLVSEATFNNYDIFVRDTVTNTTTLLSNAPDGSPGNSFSGHVTISGDGRFVVFQSNSSNLISGDSNSSHDIFLKDLTTGALSRISSTSSGAAGDGAANNPSISVDGRYVAYTSYSTNIVSGDTNGFADIMVWDRLTGVTRKASTDASGNQSNGDSTFGSISGDGRFVSFTSTATNLVSGDTNGVNDVFVKDLLTGEITRASVDKTGDQTTVASNALAQFGITRDGRYVGFLGNSGGTLIEGQTSSARNFYITRRVGGEDSPTSALSSHHGLYITSQISARYALDRINLYRDEMSTIRSDIGSGLSRFEVANRTLAVRTENYQAARSRIVDADMAEESSSLIRQGILQQGASSILAQANQQPALALRLLQP